MRKLKFSTKFPRVMDPSLILTPENLCITNKNLMMLNGKYFL